MRTAYRTPFGIGSVTFEGDVPDSIELPAKGSRSRPGDCPPAIRHLVEALEAYYGGMADLVASPELIARAGTTPLLRAIYSHVAAIRPGRTQTYGEVAAAVGRPGAARAVGTAMARNPFPPVIPCHRVVGSDGTLRGYGGGLEQKRRLLEMERSHA